MNKHLVNLVHHRYWLNKRNESLKDTKEWIKVYLEATKFPTDEVDDLLEYLDHKNLLDDFQLWANGPPQGRFNEGVVKKGGVNHNPPSSTRPAPPRGQGPRLP